MNLTNLNVSLDNDNHVHYEDDSNNDHNVG